MLVAGLVLGAAGRASAAGPSYRVSLAQLQEALARRFPVRYPLGDLLDVSIATPRVRLLPELNRVGSELLLEAAGPALRRRYEGALDLDFGLRYEPADRTLRAHHLRVLALRVPQLAGRAAAVIEQAARELAEQSLAEVVLHRIEPRELALADAMGLQPGPITVTATGLVIDFVNKPS